MNQENATTRVKIAVLGDKGVGKSSLIKHYVIGPNWRNHEPSFDPIMEEDYVKTITFTDNLGRERQQRCTILDPFNWWYTGPPRKVRNSSSYMKTITNEAIFDGELAPHLDRIINDNEAFLLVYDITSRMSFESVAMYYNKIITMKTNQKNNDNLKTTNDEMDTSVPMVVVGNGMDKLVHTQRQVTLQEGLQYATEIGSVHFEISLEQETNIQECFVNLVQRCVAMKDQMNSNLESTVSGKGSDNNKLNTSTLNCCVLL